MKLAEALQERADLNRKIDQLRARLSANATVQEGEKPGEGGVGDIDKTYTDTKKTVKTISRSFGLQFS